MTYRQLQIFWRLLALGPAVMTGLGLYALATNAWPLEAAPIALACALLTGWALHLDRGTQTAAE
jgi:hypothetical protein